MYLQNSDSSFIQFLYIYFYSHFNIILIYLKYRRDIEQMCFLDIQ